MKLSYLNLSEIQRLQKSVKDPLINSQLLADAFRLNTLYMVMRAGSGHLGSSFSAMDIITWLWTQEMKNSNDPKAKDADIYFSSKGHDVPGLYSLLIGLGRLNFDLIHQLRRLNGLPGHPDVTITPNIVTNTGPLGMGISKAHGMAIANRLQNKKGRIFVLTGDGELQEGQIWESLRSAVNGKFNEITVIVDHNKIQSDTWVKDINDLGDLEARFEAHGWAVFRCDGHDMQALKKTIVLAKEIKDKPQVIIADTIKGKGVSLMEQMAPDKFYKFHSGAPSIENYNTSTKELLNRINDLLKKQNVSEIKLETLEIPDRVPPVNPQKLVAAYGDELLKIAKENKNVVALDADLVLDTGLILFQKEIPERFVECGIAEQDMVSTAGGLALRGMLPVVHSFACFLTTRPNEQLYNNASEKTKIIYVGSLAGLLPATPGHSHQSIRDISAIGGIPGLIMVQPADEREARMAIRWAVEKNKNSSYIRLVSIPCELEYQLPSSYSLEKGRGVFLKEGKDVAIVAYGPVMLQEAYKAAELLSHKKISVAVLNLPWLNFLDPKWLIETLGKFKKIVTIDDHYLHMGQGALIGSIFAHELDSHPKIISLGLYDIPACGQLREVLEYHKLDAESIAERIVKNL